MKPRTINRVNTPRKIRDIRPKRQLPRPSEKKLLQQKQQQEEQDGDDWWYDDAEETSSQLRGVAANRRFGKRLDRNNNSSRCEEDDDDDVPRNRIYARLKCILSRLKCIYGRIRQVPKQKRRKIVLAVVLLYYLWRTIFSVNLDQYSFSEKKSTTSAVSQPMRSSIIQSLDDDFSSSLIGGIAFGATSKTQHKMKMGDVTGIRGPSFGTNGISSGPMDSNGMFKRELNTGMQSSSYPSPQKPSMNLGGSNYGGITSGNSYTGSDNNKMQSSNALDPFSPNMIETKSSSQLAGGSLGGIQSQTSWTNSQTQGQKQVQYNSQPKMGQALGGSAFGNEQLVSSNLRGQASFGNSQSMTNLGLVSTPLEYKQPNSNALTGSGNSYGSNGFAINDSSALKSPFSSQGTLGAMSGSDNVNGNGLIQNAPIQGKGFGSLSSLQLNTQQRQAQTDMLQCADHGGPYSESEYSEIIYWHDIPTDVSFTSPYYNSQAQESLSASFWKSKFLTFEMDDAGWNNMRLGLESVILLAHATGRTLVMPPKRQISHGMRNKNGSKVVSFQDFYDIDAINKRQKGLNIITMEQFLEREAINGHLQNKDGEILYPPDHQVKWDNKPLQPLWEYIRSIAKVSEWHPRKCVLAFPAAGSDENHLYSMMNDVLVGKDGRPFPHYSEYQGKPTNVDAPPIERFREILAGRREICMYDKKIHDDNFLLHFSAEQVDGTRLITQFYSFLWFEDWRHDLWSKRFIRDNLRYNDEIMCLAARVISALRSRARKHSLGNANGLFDAVHIRRGDFHQQFPTYMDASEILTGLKEYIAPGSTLFIATDERDLSFFSSIQEVYDVAFLGDFGSMLADINPNFFPLVEQIVASRGRIFIGTFYSTFSAYISRLRGYYSVKELRDMTGGLQNTYFLPSKFKKEMRLYQAIHEPMFARDFPVAWRDIDRLENNIPSIQNDMLQLNGFF